MPKFRWNPREAIGFAISLIAVAFGFSALFSDLR